MASSLPSFEYDIFISYRHNDNKSGWVTEFVNALQEELGSTIKETLTIYFDKNPLDGLRENDNVDKSLERKLKCLVFVPILSQTYCDPKSFAWQHEFVAFNELAKQDQFGRDIELSNGNVASRILPIKVHQLDVEDTTAIEKEIGGALRGIEFIYKSGGVNRPLNAKDDEVRLPGKILYRDQVNKVANAIKEIFYALKNNEDHAAVPAPVLTKTKSRNIKVLAVGFSALLMVLVIGYLAYPKINTPSESPAAVDKSIAVLPFVDMSPAHDQEYFGDGIAEEIITALSRIKGLKVIGRTSSFQFKGEKIDLRDVGEKLDVSHVLEGSVMKSGHKIRITAQLISVSDGAHIWSERFDKETEDIFAINDQISSAISDKMKISLLGTHDRTDKRPTLNTEAFENYLRGNQVLLPGRGDEARPFFEKAIQLDPNYADAYAGMAWSYFFSRKEGLPEAWFQRISPLAQKISELDPESEKSHTILYVIYLTYKWDWKKSDDEYRIYQSMNSTPLVGHALYLGEIMGDVNGGIREMEQILVSDPINKDVLRLTGYLYALDKQFAKAKLFAEKAIELDSAYGLSYRNLARINIMAGEYDLALDNLARVDRLDKNKIYDTSMPRIWALVKAHRLADARKIYATLGLSPNTFSFDRGIRRAKIEFWMGNLDEGFRLLEEAFQRKEYEVLTIRTNPFYDIVRDHPRFKEFIKKVPFPPNN
jgi:adenylate cyclase